MDNAAKEYAAALFLLAQENHAHAAFADGLNTVKTQFAQQPDYVATLASPVIPKAERQNALKQAFAGNLPDEVLALVQLLCKNGHIRAFDTCYQAYMDAYNAMQKTAEAHVTAALPLTDAEQKQLVKTLEQKTGYTIRATFAVDPALLGGITVELNGTVIDGSLKHRLHELKEVITA